MVRFRPAIQSILLSFVVLAAQSANAVDLDLFLCIDGSGSISSTDFNLQRQGTANAIQSEIPATGQVRVTVLQFAGSTTTVEVAPTIINGTTIAGVVQAVNAMQQRSGGTPMASCIDSVVQILGGVQPAARQVIDISTDGSPNSQATTQAAAMAAQQAGVDALNALGVGNANVTFLESIVFPQPAGGNSGFVEQASDFSTFATAFQRKIRTEIQQISGYCGVGNVSDLNRNGFPETAAATEHSSGTPIVYVRDQGTGGNVQVVGFFNRDFDCIAFSTELNRGTMLARHIPSGRIFSQTRNLANRGILGRAFVLFP